MARWTAGGSAEVERIAAELDRWRRCPRRGHGIPEGIWRDVATVAQAQGVHRVARSLGLNYDSVKRRASGWAVASKRKERPAFVELGPQSVGGDGSCVMELSTPSGVRLTVKGVSAEQLSALVATVMSRGR